MITPSLKGGGVEWIDGIEAQDNGNPHTHLLVDTYIDDGWLANAWADCGDGDDAGGYVKIQQVDDDGVGGGGAVALRAISAPTSTAA